MSCTYSLFHSHDWPCKLLWKSKSYRAPPSLPAPWLGKCSSTISFVFLDSLTDSCLTRGLMQYITSRVYLSLRHTCFVQSLFNWLIWLTDFLLETNQVEICSGKLRSKQLSTVPTCNCISHVLPAESFLPAWIGSSSWFTDGTVFLQLLLHQPTQTPTQHHLPHHKLPDQQAPQTLTSCTCELLPQLKLVMSKKPISSAMHADHCTTLALTWPLGPNGAQSGSLLLTCTHSCHCCLMVNICLVTPSNECCDFHHLRSFSFPLLSAIHLFSLCL